MSEDPAEPRGGADPTRLVPRWRRGLDAARRVLSKAMEDNIFFMAGAIAFNFLVAVVPLVLLLVGIAGFVARARFVDPSGVVVPYLLEILPAIQGEVNLIENLRGVIDGVVEERAGYSVVGSVVLLWVATRLVETLRVALNEIFDITQRRSFVRGKLFDAVVVVVGGVLFLANIAATVVVEAVGRYGLDRLGLEGWGGVLSRELLAHVVAFATIWVLFVTVYRYLPARRIPWRTAIVAATFMAVLHEAMKAAFSWYAASVADFRSTFGNLTTAAVLFIWIYNGCLVFILGGEVAQIYSMNRVRRITIRQAHSKDDG